MAPPLTGLGATFVSGRGSELPPLLLAILAALLVSGGLCFLVVRRRRKLAILAGVEVLCLLWFLASFGALPDGVAPAVVGYDFALPPARPPAGMAVQRIVTGVIRRTAAFAYRGGGFGDRRTFTMNAVLIRHPAGDLLVDTGFGVDVAAHLSQMPPLFQWITRVERRRSAREALLAAHYDPSHLRAILLTHAHWDHVSGAAELTPVPVWLPAPERAFMHEGWATAVARTIPQDRLQTYAFDGGAYLHFGRSRDVFGDGSVVIVPAPGHTPGSVVLFIALPSGQRLALIGDLAWQLEGVLERRERPLITRIGDVDPGQARVQLAQMAAMHARYPQIDLVPAHDPRGYDHIPELVPEGATGE